MQRAVTQNKTNFFYVSQGNLLIILYHCPSLKLLVDFELKKVLLPPP